jgi:hypothetical protein
MYATDQFNTQTLEYLLPTPPLIFLFVPSATGATAMAQPQNATQQVGQCKESTAKDDSAEFFLDSPPPASLPAPTSRQCHHIQHQQQMLRHHMASRCAGRWRETRPWRVLDPQRAGRPRASVAAHGLLI